MSHVYTKTRCNDFALDSTQHSLIKLDSIVVGREFVVAHVNTKRKEKRSNTHVGKKVTCTLTTVLKEKRSGKTNYGNGSGGMVLTLSENNKRASDTSPAQQEEQA